MCPRMVGWRVLFLGSERVWSEGRGCWRGRVGCREEGMAREFPVTDNGEDTAVRESRQERSRPSGVGGLDMRGNCEVETVSSHVPREMQISSSTNAWSRAMAESQSKTRFLVVLSTIGAI